MTLTEEIVRAYLAGMSDVAVRETFGHRASLNTLNCLMSRARKKLHIRRPRGRLATPALAVLVDRQTYSGFVTEADKRGVEPNELLRKLVSVLVNDALFDAVIENWGVPC